MTKNEVINVLQGMRGEKPEEKLFIIIYKKKFKSHNACFILKVPIGGGSTKSVFSDKLIVYTKSRKQLLHRKYLLYETGCITSMFKVMHASIHIGCQFISINLALSVKIMITPISPSFKPLTFRQLNEDPDGLG